MNITLGEPLRILTFLVVVSIFYSIFIRLMMHFTRLASPVCGFAFLIYIFSFSAIIFWKVALTKIKKKTSSKPALNIVNLKILLLSQDGIRPLGLQPSMSVLVNSGYHIELLRHLGSCFSCTTRNNGNKRDHLHWPEYSLHPSHCSRTIKGELTCPMVTEETT